IPVFIDNGAERVKSGTLLVLLAGFGGLLALMAFAGIDSIQVLGQVEQRNVQVRQMFLLRNRALEQIRSAVYLSGTYARDFLLETDPARAEIHRANLQRIHGQMESALASYSRSISHGHTGAFQTLAAEIRQFWKTLDPIFQWDAREKHVRIESFLINQLSPRRNTTLKIADAIGAMNERELSAGDDQLEDIFDRFRSRLTWMLAITLAVGLLLAAFTIRHILRLARDADLRYRQIARAQSELKELSARLVEAQEQERRAISRELHDEVGQSLSALLMELGNVGAVAPAGNTEVRQHLDAIRKLAESSVNVVRNMSLLLRPSMLDDLGLVPALQWQAR